MKLKPSGYVPAAQHAIGFAKRMKGYEDKVKAEKAKLDAKVTAIKKAKP